MHRFGVWDLHFALGATLSALRWRYMYPDRKSAHRFVNLQRICIEICIDLSHIGAQ